MTALFGQAMVIQQRAGRWSAQSTFGYIRRGAERRERHLEFEKRAGGRKSLVLTGPPQHWLGRAITGTDIGLVMLVWDCLCGVYICVCMQECVCKCVFVHVLELSGLVCAENMIPQMTPPS